MCQPSFTKVCECIIECTDGNYKTMVRNLYILYKRTCLALYANSFGNTNRISDCYKAVGFGGVVLDITETYGVLGEE